MPVAVIIDWYGPFDSLDEFKAEIQLNWRECYRCMYMALKQGNLVNYIGMTSRPTGRFSQHPKMRDITNKRFFLGEIVSQGVAGRRIKKTRTDIDLAEHALISCLNPDLNERRSIPNLSDCVSVYSRFFKKDYETPCDPLPKFPKHIAFNSWTGEFDLIA